MTDHPKPPPPPLRVWTVYKNPTDYPDKYVARMFEGSRPTPNVIITETLNELRTTLFLDLHLTKLSRSPGDDSKIVEVWI